MGEPTSRIAGQDVPERPRGQVPTTMPQVQMSEGAHVGRKHFDVVYMGDNTVEVYLGVTRINGAAERGFMRLGFRELRALAAELNSAADELARRGA